MESLIPIHGGYVGPPSMLLVIVIIGTAIGAAVLLGLAIGALAQRQTRPYFLIVGAFTALFARAAVAGVAMAGSLSPWTHHFLEHMLDIVLVALVIAAVYYARSVSQDRERIQHDTSA